jgi:hypothetical protein
VERIRLWPQEVAEYGGYYPWGAWPYGPYYDPYYPGPYYFGPRSRFGPYGWWW